MCGVDRSGKMVGTMMERESNRLPLWPDDKGRFGEYGGRYVPETLIPALEELAAEYDSALHDAAFKEEMEYHLKDFVGRATPLYLAERLSAEYDARIYLKR